MDYRHIIIIQNYTALNPTKRLLNNREILLFPGMAENTGKYREILGNTGKYWEIS